MGQFLEIARKSLMDEFRELRGCSSDNLLYIKEDLIIPHDMTFHYLIEVCVCVCVCVCVYTHTHTHTHTHVHI